jgi:hypothetical protein
MGKGICACLILLVGYFLKVFFNWKCITMIYFFNFNINILKSLKKHLKKMLI